MENIRFGLLPMYLQLYDEVVPQRRDVLEGFYGLICREFEKRGLQPETAGPCRTRAEFSGAISAFEDAEACAVVTLHLAYSPSLESIDALAGTRLPVIVLDTTPDPDFGPSRDPGLIMSNHGIHGVQDMCNLLLRRGKDFAIEAGHWERSDVLDRVCEHIRASAMAAVLRSTRTGIVGERFEGMGDFAVEEHVLEELTGNSPSRPGPREMAEYAATVSDEEIDAETAADRGCFAAAGVCAEAHRSSTLAGLALRRWLDCEEIDAFSVNFLSITRSSGMPAMPFLEISKAMARGKGYAGEGDLLTASLIHAIASFFSETTFTEMFCPDWQGNRVFLSHMGEVNIELLADVPELVVKPFPYTDAGDPVVAVGRLKPGPAVFVNVAPVSADRFRLIMAPGHMHDAEKDGFQGVVHGWLEPQLPLADLLEVYSCLGGTHHAALVYGDPTGLLVKFGAVMGWETYIIGD